jgi:hypothetical protein
VCNPEQAALHNDEFWPGTKARLLPGMSVGGGSAQLRATVHVLPNGRRPPLPAVLESTVTLDRWQLPTIFSTLVPLDGAVMSGARPVWK